VANTRSLNFRYRPSGPTLSKFHQSNEFVRCLIGPLGSGKTTACAVEVYLRATSQEPNEAGVRRTRWLVVRNTAPELLTTTIPSWQNIYTSVWGDFKRNPPMTHEVRFNLPDGTAVECDVIFMGLDGPDAANKIRGLELTGAWVNESRDVNKSVVDMLTGRVGRFPPMREGSGPTWYGIIMDTNPPDDDHYLFKFAEAEHPEGWEFYKQPGGMVRQGKEWVVNPHAENLDFLPGKSRYYYNQAAGKSDDWISVYLGGNYGFVQEGKPVFPEYSEGVHVKELRPLPGVPLHVAADFGLTPAAVICQRAPSGQILIVDELVTDGIGAKTFGQMLSRQLRSKYRNFEVETFTGDPAGSQRSQADEVSVFQILNAMGLPFRPAPTNDFILRREAVALPLSSLREGLPGLVVNKSCILLRKALAGGYHFRRVQVSAERYMDRPEKNDSSHIAEALQYACLALGEGNALIANPRMANQGPPRVRTHIPKIKKRNVSVLTRR
jgi:hypothetical protein